MSCGYPVAFSSSDFKSLGLANHVSLLAETDVSISYLIYICGIFVWIVVFVFLCHLYSILIVFVLYLVIRICSIIERDLYNIFVFRRSIKLSKYKSNTYQTMNKYETNKNVKITSVTIFRHQIYLFCICRVFGPYLIWIWIVSFNYEKNILQMFTKYQTNTFVKIRNNTLQILGKYYSVIKPMHFFSRNSLTRSRGRICSMFFSYFVCI